MKKLVFLILAVMIFQAVIVAVLLLPANCSSTKSSDIDDMEEGVVYLTDFSVKYTSAKDSPNGDINESALYEEIDGTTQSYYYVMEFDMQTASNIDKMEYLTVELCVLDSDVVETIINYTNTSNTSVKTVDGQTTITATYSLPEKAKALKSVQLVIELKPLNNGASDIVYSFSSDNKSVSGYDQTDCTYSLSDGGVTIGNTSLSYTLNSNGKSYWVSGVGTKSECKNLVIKSYWNGLPVMGIEEKAFYGKTYITGISIPDTVIYIGRNAFTNTGYYNDESNWEDGVLYLNNYLIDASNNGSASYRVKDGTEAIAAYAFNEKSSLEYIYFPDGLVYIDGYAFYKCTSLTDITIPDTVLYIDDYAFAYCSAITELLLSDGLEGLGSRVFYNCTALTSVTIGKNVISVGSKAFYNCTALEEINYNAIFIDDFSYSSNVFSNAGKNSDSVKVSIGSEVTKIPAYLFYDSYITSLKFENNSQCNIIGAYAFCECTSLSSISLPNSLTTIEKYAFERSAYYNDDSNWDDNVLYIGTYLIRASGITDDYTVKAGTTVIADYAFYQCGSKNNFTVTIASSVKYIGAYAFYWFSYRGDLEKVIFENTSGWWVSESATDTSGTSVNVKDPEENASYLESKSSPWYYKYYWRRS